MIYTAARSLSQGTRAGIFSALGMFAGCLLHTTAAVFGLSKIIEESVLLFSIIKYAGQAISSILVYDHYSAGKKQIQQGKPCQR